MRQLSENEDQIIKKVVQEHPVHENGGLDPSFEVFICWMAKCIESDIGGIAKLMQTPPAPEVKKEEAKKKEGSKWDVLTLQGSKWDILRRKSFAQIMAAEQEETAKPNTA